jgi:hypothetical protein
MAGVSAMAKRGHYFQILGLAVAAQSPPAYLIPIGEQSGYNERRTAGNLYANGEQP